MEREPCPVCDRPNCLGRCPDSQRATKTLRRLREAVEGLEDSSIDWPVWFNPGRVVWVSVNVVVILDESTVGVLFEKPDKVRYLKKCERVGAVVPDYFVEDEHE